MSRTVHKTKAIGYEYWTPRPGGRSPGKITKKITHGIERARKRKEIEGEVEQ